MGRRSDYRSPETIKTMAVDAAEFLVSRQGVSGMNARSIAKRMGYAPGTIYVVFKNMQELKLHVNARTLDRLQQALEESLEQCRTAETCIKKLAYTYFFYAVDNKALWTLLFSTSPEDEHIPDWYLAKVEQVFSIVESKLPDYFSTRRTKRLAARTIWASIHGICTLAFTNKLAISNVNSAKQLIDMLFTNFLAGQKHTKGLQ